MGGVGQVKEGGVGQVKVGGVRRSVLDSCSECMLVCGQSMHTHTPLRGLPT